MCFSKFKKDSVQFLNQKKLDPKLLSGWSNHASGRPSVSRRFELFKLASVRMCACIRPNVLATRPNALQSSRKIQRSSASVRTTWQYRPDISQCLTSKRISFADTDMGRQLQPSIRQVYTVWTLSLIRQDVEKNCNHPDVRAKPSRRQSLLWKLSATEVQLSGGLLQPINRGL
jgi:hypothetical protein